MTVSVLPERTGQAQRPARWIPTRAGILNVWRYYDEVFEFHDGRLLLRGPNGSGKSKALELLLPFLFDASLRPNRLSTFGTGERTMHWNMMGEGNPGTTRVGYVWLEFRCPGADEEWFTCGARLQATSRTTSVHPDYFTTRQRVGIAGAAGALRLTQENRPLTRAALAEQLAGAGRVHDDAGDYRTTLRTTLFPSLNEQRYDAMITALLQLRTPKLSQRLDPSLLSTLLSRALPPLGHDDLADLAEGFERLDAQRERLSRLDQEVTATRTLARHQQTYARRVLRAQAARLISATSEMDKFSAAARKSAEEYEHAVRQRADTEGAEASDTVASQQAQGRLEGFRKSKAYEEGSRLEEVRKQVEQARRRAEDAADRAQSTQSLAKSDATRHAQALNDQESREQLAAAAADEAREAAHRAGMTSVYRELTQRSAAEAVRPLLRGALRSRTEELDKVARVLRARETAVREREDAESALEIGRTRAATAAQYVTAAAEEREREADALRDRIKEWAQACRALIFEHPETLVALAEHESDLIDAVNRAARSRLQEFTKQSSAYEQVVVAVNAERAAAVTERDRLRAEHDIEPPAPAWRTTDRTRMLGAPLWRLIDFASAIAPATAARIEAALEAAGLLDAWVSAGGTVEGHDIFADPTALAAVSGANLTDVLVAVPDAGVPPEAVHRLLAAVAYGDQVPAGAVAGVGADGSWRLGNTTGTAGKEQPAYIGATTRQQARQRRIRELTDEIAEHDAALAATNEQLHRLSAQQELLESEVAGRPDYDRLTAADGQLVRAESDLNAAEAQVRERVESLSRRETAVKQVLHTLAALAAETGLPTETTALTALRDALDDFNGQATAWLDAQQHADSARNLTTARSEQAQRSAAEAARDAEHAARAETEYRVAAAECEGIEQSVGSEYREVLAEISRLGRQIGEYSDRIEAYRQRLVDLAGELGRLEEKCARTAAAFDDATELRDRHAQRFRHLALGSLPADSELPDLAAFREALTVSDGVRAALDAARLIAAAWPSIPYEPANVNDAARRLNDSVHECRTALAGRADLDLETDEDIQVFAAVVDGIRVGSSELLRILTAEAQESKKEITEQERLLFDRTLTGDTRRHLAARIRQANELVDAMNTRLRQVRTSSNVAVQLVWQVGKDLPPGTKAARDLLLKDPAGLGDADRESLHRFLRDRIEEAKADGTAASWEQQLAQVFDYTAWHHFVVKIDRGKGDGFQELTKKLHGALSGGEKAIALHLPLFAAVAAHYQAASRAPRVILLDEVFVGVDTANRGQIFALLSALDLDLVLTSDHEWCTYEELSGIAIHQIVGGDGDEAVTTARFTWNGRELNPDVLPDAPEL
ncbi:TIGR02680 family protein [Nocardia zapadnayensis]|uniref:TIGR02680 family protein n=1 Tax=Nocardia rhamnosiphila TaxID=426716 RepID=UPI002247B3FC|nr:TIGR02680 family protein [Nocardia zapadnayensis]MCX0274223.1 TIGR02680 family protein [Nocardia zapadnayensis]